MCRHTCVITCGNCNVTLFAHASPARFRDQQLADVLESAYNMTRCEYLRAVQSLAAGATAWQQYEVALYGLRAVHLM